MKDVDFFVPKVTCFTIVLFFIACAIKNVSFAFLMMLINPVIFFIEDCYKDFITDGEHIEKIKKRIKDKETKRCTISDKLKELIKQNNVDFKPNEFITKFIDSNISDSESIISIINNTYNDQNFESLMTELQNIDENISNLKREYNHYVDMYNDASEKKGIKIIMFICRYKKKNFEKIEN